MCSGGNKVKAVSVVQITQSARKCARFQDVAASQESASCREMGGLIIRSTLLDYRRTVMKCSPMSIQGHCDKAWEATSTGEVSWHTAQIIIFQGHRGVVQ
jgi:hypothetical protein